LVIKENDAKERECFPEMMQIQSSQDIKALQIKKEARFNRSKSKSEASCAGWRKKLFASIATIGNTCYCSRGEFTMSAENHTYCCYMRCQKLLPAAKPTDLSN
jgi:hypothetical protein